MRVGLSISTNITKYKNRISEFMEMSRQTHKQAMLRLLAQQTFTY